MKAELVKDSPPTSLQFDQHEPSITITSGAVSMKLFKDPNTKLITMDKPTMGVGAAEVDPSELAVKLNTAMLLDVGQYYLSTPSDKSREAVIQVHEAYADLLKEDPKEAVNVAIKTGLALLKQVLGGQNLEVTVGDGELELLPCTMKLTEIEVKNGGEDKPFLVKKGVRITCGDSHVVLIDVGDGIGPVEQGGDTDGLEMRNIKAVFIMLNEPINLYLNERRNKAGELKVSAEALLVGMQALEEVKLDQPDKIKELLPLMEAGEVRMSIVMEKAEEETEEAFLDGLLGTDDSAKDENGQG